MKKLIYTLLLIAPASVFAQLKVGNNPTTVNADAVFEAESSNKGMLIPRVALTATNSASPLSSFTAGMVVYNTATAGLSPNQVAPGYYYCDGTKWVSAGASLSNVNITSPTSPAGNTIGQMVYNTNSSGGVPVGPVYWNGTTWVSAAGNNIYNADGALTANRTVALGSKNLIFSNTGGNIGFNTVSPAVGLHANTPLLVSGNGTANSQGTYVVWNDPNISGTLSGASGFLNHRGSGFGGYVFSGTADNNTITEYMRIEGQKGHVAVNGPMDANTMMSIFDNGNATGVNVLKLRTTRNNSSIAFASSSFALAEYNDIVKKGDARLIFDTDGDATVSADSGFAIAPWSTSASGATGLKIMENGRVGINTAAPDNSAALDVNSTTRGILPPRLTTTQRDAIANPASGLVIYNTIDSSLQVNTGSPAIPRWTKAQLDNRANFFYAPTLSIPVTALVTSQNLDLWAAYNSQFTAPAFKNNAAPASIPTFANNQLNYYITSYDNTIIKINSLSDAGVLNYDVISTTPSFSSYINVVFTVK